MNPTHASANLAWRSRLFLAVVAVVPGLLAGCAAVGPDYRAPEPLLPAAWQAALPHDGQAQQLARWWQQFDDPLLLQLQAAAQSTHPVVLKALAAIDEARAALLSRDAEALPQLNAGTAVQRSGEARQTLPQENSSLRLAADASWEIDLFGAVRRTSEAVSARLDARHAEWDDARTSLAAEVASRYVSYRACQQLDQQWQADVASRKNSAASLQQAQSAGLRAAAEVDLALAGLAETRNQQRAQASECLLLIKSLVVLSGWDETTLQAALHPVGADVVLPRPQQFHVTELPAIWVSQRPDLVAVERQLAASLAEVGVAQARRYPRLSLLGNLTASHSLVGGAHAQPWSFGPSLSLPWLDGGRREAELDAARARHAAALAAYRLAVRNAVREVEEALVRLDAARQRSDDVATAAAAYARFFASTEQQWQHGLVSLLSLEEARRSAQQAQRNQISLAREHVLQWIALYKALGGGWAPGSPGLAADPDATTIPSPTPSTHSTPPTSLTSRSLP